MFIRCLFERLWDAARRILTPGRFRFIPGGELMPGVHECQVKDVVRLDGEKEKNPGFEPRSSCTVNLHQGQTQQNL